ncbi:Na/Pi cotransporter family protein [Jhaorihella thermophila]
MTQQAFILIGGVGMFLLGMDVMTRALKEAAGGNLRRILARFTATPLQGVLTGAAATAVIQSSSATTVMTVGFVGAGLMSLMQALGVMFGANIGTTVTGWLVAILGFKMHLEEVAMLVLLPASLSILLLSGAAARAGRVVAGLCVILIGLDLMQSATGNATEWLTPDRLPDTGALGILLLAASGLVLTVAIQSSSAAVALALVMLQGGAISVPQGGGDGGGDEYRHHLYRASGFGRGSRPMRQAAVANLLFNLGTAAIAFPFLLYGGGHARGDSRGLWRPHGAAAFFHTGFNVVGTAVFLPFAERFAQLVARLVPEREADRLICLDRGLLSNPDAALMAAHAAAVAIVQRVEGALARALREPQDLRAIAALEPATSAALDDLSDFLAAIRLPADRKGDNQLYSALLHMADHARRLLWRTRQKARMGTLMEDWALRRPALVMGAIFARSAQKGAPGFDPERLERLQEIVAHRVGRHRRALLLGEHAGLYSVQEVFAHTDAMRWLTRVLHHAERIAHYDALARQVLRQGRKVAKENPDAA